MRTYCNVQELYSISCNNLWRKRITKILYVCVYVKLNYLLCIWNEHNILNQIRSINMDPTRMCTMQGARVCNSLWEYLGLSRIKGGMLENPGPVEALSLGSGGSHPTAQRSPLRTPAGLAVPDLTSSLSSRERDSLFMLAPASRFILSVSLFTLNRSHA